MPKERYAHGKYKNMDKTVVADDCGTDKEGNAITAACSLTGEWIYNQCTTCCCKNGESFQFSYKQRMDELHTPGKTTTAECGMWFSTVDAFMNAVLPWFSRLHNLQNWGSRCVKF